MLEFLRRSFSSDSSSYEEVPSPFHSSQLSSQPTFVIEEVLEYEKDEVEISFGNGVLPGDKSDNANDFRSTNEACRPKERSLSQRLCERLSGK